MLPREQSNLELSICCCYDVNIYRAVLDPQTLSYYKLEEVDLLTVTSTEARVRVDFLYNVIASHTINVVCVNFVREWRDLQFNNDPELQIFLLGNF